MKSYIIASALLVAGITGAQAADVVVQEPVAVYNWSGIYVGGAVGYNKLSAEFLDFTDDNTSSNGRVSGAVYGGYNFQIDNIVLGVEADVKSSGSVVEKDTDYLVTKQRWGASFRGRAGYAIGEVLPYFTAGAAVAKFRGDHDNDGYDVTSKTATGYVIGGGIEWAATQNIVLRGEYLFSNFGDNDLEYSGNDIHPIKLRTHDVRFGIAYKF